MLSPEDLYDLVDVIQPADEPDATDVPAQTGRPVLLHALTGFVDAGHAANLTVQHLLSELPARDVAHFDVDQLIDYRGRRPRMTFRSDRFTDIDQHRLTVHALTDEAGQEFYLLSGPEPDFQWERFIAAVLQLVDHLGIGLVAGIHGIPWAAPHTRPIGLTSHASSRELIAGRPRWIGDVDVPGHVGALLELRATQAGHDAVGFTAHVPHYLAEAEFPPAATALLEAVADVARLSLPTAALREAGTSVLTQIDAQVADSPQTLHAVQGLERTYDAVTAGRSLSGTGLLSPTLPDDEMPGGDELAAQVEDFLRGLEETPGDD